MKYFETKIKYTRFVPSTEYISQQTSIVTSWDQRGFPTFQALLKVSLYLVNCHHMRAVYIGWLAEQIGITSDRYHQQEFSYCKQASRPLWYDNAVNMGTAVVLGSPSVTAVFLSGHVTLFSNYAWCNRIGVESAHYLTVLIPMPWRCPGCSLSNL